MKKLRPLILFGIGGLIYVLIELIARGRSHWSMFIVGGLAFFLIGCINEKSRKMPLVRQMLIGAIVITASERARERSILFLKAEQQRQGWYTRQGSISGALR